MQIIRSGRELPLSYSLCRCVSLTVGCSSSCLQNSAPLLWWGHCCSRVRAPHEVLTVELPAAIRRDSRAGASGRTIEHR